MHNIERHKLQAFPFHLVDPSPWPILTSFSLLTMAIGAVLYFHGFNNGGYMLLLGFFLTASAMTLWFKDIDRREFNLLISLLIPTLILGIFSPYSQLSWFSIDWDIDRIEK